MKKLVVLLVVSAVLFIIGITTATASQPHQYTKGELLAAITDHPSLDKGDTGAAVAAIQIELNRTGVAEIANGKQLQIDGRFGPLTEHAVNSWKDGVGLKADGHVGIRVWKTLYNECWTPQYLNCDDMIEDQARGIRR